ncbi:MAG TPA: aminotransferase class I/II-fold pyridoxal phosphate-dependent enzyme [Acidobacteriota bacterium]|nr:aminotransferase class I/II-fold pyridoxal phosphate-dependent enzyme [Acidobacteriota bacterium]
MRLDEFKMERLQSTWENRVKFNLSESSVHPMSVRELISDPDFLEEVLDAPLFYNQSNGTDELRSAIAACYPNATLDNVEVTNGGSEANFITIYSMLDPGDEVVIILPNYGQIWGLTNSLGMSVREVHLREDLQWAPDLEELQSAATADTRMIVVCNPNNPTGAILTPAEMNAIIETAARSGAWILADEIYQGSERSGNTSQTFWGKYDRVIVTNGLSKAYGLPGLRIGWIVAPKDRIAKMWSYHDYTTIAPGTLSDTLARVALSPGGRARCFERTRGICRQNFPLFQRWIETHGSMFRMVEPKAGAIAYVRYDLPINSTRLVERLLHEKSVLVVPGDHFGMDQFLRIGYGPQPDYLNRALELVNQVLETTTHIESQP